MAEISVDAPELLTPLGDFLPENLSFEATLNAHGLYTTEEFVLRLSPRVHELVDAITRGETAGYERADLVRATPPISTISFIGGSMSARRQALFSV